MIWTARSLLRQIELGEDSRLEFKEAFFEEARVGAPARKVVADELAAFANSSGGTLVFSVSDEGEVRQLSRSQIDTLETFIGDICSDSIKPPLHFKTQRLALPGELAVLVIEIEQSPFVHKSPGGYLDRRGSSKREMTSQALQRLFRQRGRSGLLGPDEVPVADSGRGTLDSVLLDRFLSSRTLEPADTQLAKLGLLGEDDAGVTRATVAGVLLSTERPDRHIPGAVIQAVRYRGTILGKATQHDAATITGPLDRQVGEAVRFVRRNTRVAARKAPGRVEIPQFSPRAVFEAIVNAVVHRDYSLENSGIRMFIFDDRLELYSPGALANTLSLDAMRTRQATRNEALASLLRMLRIGDIDGAGDRQFFLELRGEGVPVIYEQTRELTGQDPEYELLDNAELRLTLPSARPPVEGIAGEVLVTADGQPLAGARVVAHYPNKTWMEATTDSFGRAEFGFYADLPITVYCGAPGHGGHVEPAWRPPAPLSVDLRSLPDGGSAVFTERTGHLPGLKGRLNPILDTLDRTYLYATNIAIENGRQQPVHFKLNQALRLTDVHGCEWTVRFIDLFGNSALLEYQPPPPPQAPPAQTPTGTASDPSRASP